jgi:cytochrome c peroxidase
MRPSFALLVTTLLASAAEPPAPNAHLQPVPRGLASRPSAPADIPLTPDKVALGKRLFSDPILSADRTLSCASCHLPDRGFAGPDALAIGVRGQKNRRNAPTLLNIAYSPVFFWDGRSATLEEQALLPIADPREMASSPDEAVDRLRADVSYVAQFRAAFGETVTKENLARALASFERTLLSGDNAVDRFRAGQVTDLSEDAKQGLWLFEGRGGCWKCHSGSTMSDGRFHNTGVGWGGGDLGRFEVTQRDSDRGAFKTPILRDVAHTAPYMHDGSLATLEDVVRYYGRGGNPNPHLDRDLKPIEFSDADVRHLVAFLKALNGAGQPR